MELNLLDAARKKKKGTVRKLENYFREYDVCFSPFRLANQGKTINLFEIGIQGGGSLHMWKEYFPDAHILGVDIDEACLAYADDRVSVEIGGQSRDK